MPAHGITKQRMEASPNPQDKLKKVEARIAKAEAQLDIETNKEEATSLRNYIVVLSEERRNLRADIEALNPTTAPPGNHSPSLPRFFLLFSLISFPSLCYPLPQSSSSSTFIYKMFC